MLKATITITEHVDEIEKLFSFEEKEFQNERAKYETKREGKELKFIIEAKDSTALRSDRNQPE